MENKFSLGNIYLCEQQWNLISFLVIPFHIGEGKIKQKQNKRERSHSGTRLTMAT